MVGITWGAEVDISDYRDYIQNTANLSTFISIPNNVDGTYTGVIAATITLEVYLETSDRSSTDDVIDDKTATSSRPPEVIPLTCASQG